MTVDWGALIVTAGSGLIVAYLGAGLIGWFKARRSRRAQVAGDERQARRDYITDLEADRNAWRDRALRAEAVVRVVTDYAHAARAHIDAGHPPPPPPWPENLTRI